jgi:hypothetical protein
MALTFLPGASSAQTLPDYLPSEGLVAWYPLDGNILNMADSELNGISFSGSYCPSRTGIDNSAARLPGLLRLPLLPAILSSEFSISFWTLMRNTIGHNPVQVASPNGPGRMNLGWTNPGDPRMYISELECHGGYGDCYRRAINGQMDVNHWVHMVFTVSNNQAVLFKNGTQLELESYSCNLDFVCSSPAMSLWFGGDVGGGAIEYYDGDFDDIGIWDRALTAPEVMGLFLAEAPLPGCTDPSACNFNPEATANDGSCVPSGCMDAAACNYDAMAGCDDGSCAPAGAVQGCMDGAACNYDAAAVCAGTCVYPAAGGSDCAAGGVLCGAGTVWDVASQTCIADPTLLAEAAAEAVAEALDGVCGEGTVWHPTLGVCVPWQSCPDWPYNPDSDADGSITVIDLLALLAIFEDVDSDGDGLFDSTDDCDGVYDACGVCGGVGLDADADGVCDDADPCVGTLDACGVCNGPGPNVAVLDQIIYATDSLLVPQLGVWYVYEYPIDTLYTYECPQPECSTTSLDTYNVGAPLASFYLDYTGPGPSSFNAGPRPAGAYALQVSGTWCPGSCWSGHTADAAFVFPPHAAETTPYPFIYFNDPCLSGDNECQNNRPFPNEYNEQHVYVFYFQHPGGDLSVFGYNDGWWYDNQGGLSFQLFECTGN